MTWMFRGTATRFESSRALAGSRNPARENPKTRRAPDRRAMEADLRSPWKSKAISKAEARNRRNCWRGARSVSPDISPRLNAFVSTSMRRSRSGLSFKISDDCLSTTHEISAWGIPVRRAARAGKVWTTSPILPSFTIRILIKRRSGSPKIVKLDSCFGHFVACAVLRESAFHDGSLVVQLSLRVDSGSQKSSGKTVGDVLQRDRRKREAVAFDGQCFEAISGAVGHLETG